MSANIDNGVMLGALGSVFTDGTGAVTPPKGMVIVAIQMITKNPIQRLVAENPDKFYNTVTAANNLVVGEETVDEGGGGVQVAAGAHTFPAGMTIYGRWLIAGFSADSTGGVICYFGY